MTGPRAAAPLRGGYGGSDRKNSANGGVCARHCRHEAMKQVLPRLVIPLSARGSWNIVTGSGAAAVQGLTLVHFSAQLKRFVWDRGCV